MKTIFSNTITEIDIKNSRFITLLYKIDDNTDINAILDEVRGKYPKATHYTYAYRTLSYEKSSDDNEPGGTAGLPTLNVLIQNDLVNVCAVTVRYFGGIKLGAGGLVRAYTKSVTEALNSTSIVDLVEGVLIEIETSYDKVKQLDYILRDSLIINKEFIDTIKYTVKVTKDKLDELGEYKYKIIKEDLIEVNLS